MKETEDVTVVTPGVEVTKEDSNALMMQDIGYLKAKVEEQEKQIDELKKTCDGNKKDIKTVSMTNAAGFVLLLVTVASLVYCIWSQNNTLKSYAEAINNNSYSIESIITSIKGGPAVSE